MFERRVLTAGNYGSAHREAINENFEEYFRPKHITAHNTSAQTITNGTWTTILTPTVDYNTTDLSYSAGVWTVPVGEGYDGDNIWHVFANVAWDNTVSGLQLHQRKLRILLYNAGFPLAIATKDYLFDPDFGVTDKMVHGHHQVYTQANIKSTYTSVSLRAQVWHNAKVSGSPVSLDLKADGVVASTFRMCWLGVAE